MIATGKPITMYGDGNTSRDYTFINDTVQGIVGAMKYDKTNFEIINLGNNYSISLKELISSIEKVVGEKAVIERLSEQPGDVPKTFADISRAKKLLGYQPVTKLDGGLKRFYEWFTQNKELLVK
jgi:UDP-glucuronate 4-epimerase